MGLSRGSSRPRKKFVFTYGRQKCAKMSSKLGLCIALTYFVRTAWPFKQLLASANPTQLFFCLEHGISQSGSFNVESYELGNCGLLTRAWVHKMQRYLNREKLARILGLPMTRLTRSPQISAHWLPLLEELSWQPGRCRSEGCFKSSFEKTGVALCTSRASTGGLYYFSGGGVDFLLAAEHIFLAAAWIFRAAAE